MVNGHNGHNNGHKKFPLETNGHNGHKCFFIKGWGSLPFNKKIVTVVTVGFQGKFFVTVVVTVVTVDGHNGHNGHKFVTVVTVGFQGKFL